MHLPINEAFLYEPILLGVMLLIVYAQQMINTAVISLLHCVPAGDVTRLLIQGDNECWQIWQWMAASYIFLFIIPQCLVFLKGPQLLQQNLISSHQFILALFLPFPVLIYWLYIVGYYKKSSPNNI